MLNAIKDFCVDGFRLMAGTSLGRMPDMDVMLQKKLTSLAYEFADFHTELGNVFSEQDVENALNKPDYSYCEGKSPRAFLAEAPENYDQALAAVRVALRLNMYAPCFRHINPAEITAENLHEFTPC